MDNSSKGFMEYDIAKLNKKVSKLEAKLTKVLSENSYLKAKVNSMEDILIKLCNKVGIQQSCAITSEPSEIKTKDDTEEETWLYYIHKESGLSSDQIIKALVIDTKDSVVIDVQVNEWKEESDMYLSLLKGFSSFSEFSKDWEAMNCKELASYFNTILSATLVNDTVIILRSIPKAKKGNYEALMSNVGLLAGVMYNAWDELVSNNEIMGKMALILESEEEMNIINIISNNHRLILSVEPLKI